jgi:tetratricopeptide (TPR) repeat protein
MTVVPPGLAIALQDRYRLDRELGRGGMATVYLARDLRHDRDVALKLLRPELAALLGRDRFLAEIHLTARLDHPHILTLIDSGESDGLLWYVVPFVRGESLRQRLVREPQLPIEEAIGIIRQIAGALDYAHRQGVIHRDIKPENILLHEGQAVLCDFGIALAVAQSGGERLTETGLSIGTPQYMSPEQSTAERQLDGRSDVYSLGAVLYEMLAGEPPYSGPTAQAVIAKRMTTEPPRLRALRAGVPVAVEEAVHRALARMPADRFPSAAAFAEALADDQIGESPRPARLPASRLFAPLALLLLLAAAGAAGWWRIRHASPDPELKALTQRASHDYARRTSAGVNEAIREFSAVVKRDSTYAPAWAGLAKAYVRAYNRYFPVPGVAPDSVLQLAVTAADRARGSNPQSAEAWLAQAIVNHLVDPTDVGPVLQCVRQSLALDSTVGEAWHTRAQALAESGDLDGALVEWRHAIRVDPTYNQALAFLALGYYWQHRYDSAAVWADSAVALDPTYILARTTVGNVEIERGNFARAEAAFDAARRVSGDGDVEAANIMAGGALTEARAGRRGEARTLLQRAESLATAFRPVPLHTAVYVAEAYAALGDANRALGWLRRYDAQRDLHYQLHLRCDPPLAPLETNPRFDSLLIRPRPRGGAGC